MNSGMMSANKLNTLLWNLTAHGSNTQDQSGSIRSSSSASENETEVDASGENDLPSIHDTFKSQYSSSLSFLADVQLLYNQFAGATISIEIFNRPLNIEWWYRSRPPSPRPNAHSFSRSEAFASITLFETGMVDVPPRDLSKVLAVAEGNSIFVAKPLLSDPWTACYGSEIEMLTGNVGKLGLTLLVPPPRPRLKKLNIDTYHVINHAPFNGKLEDSFAHTTLHLSFTQYEQPVSTKAYIMKESQAYFRESLVSVHDHGQWVGHVDILSMFEDPLIFRIPLCKGQHNRIVQFDPSQTPTQGLVVIDDWYELLDPPNIDAIFRAHDNWVARLAAAAVGVQKRRRTILLSPNFCWNCAYEELRGVPKVRDLKYMTDSDESGVGSPRLRRRGRHGDKDPKAEDPPASRAGAIIIA